MPSNNERGQRLRQIPGMTPSLLDLPPGCPFRERCAHALAKFPPKVRSLYAQEDAWPVRYGKDLIALSENVHAGQEVAP